MRALLYVIVASIGVSGLCGCHCLRCTDTVMDHVDDLTTANDYGRGIDHLYCEKLDVTRWCMHGPCVGNNCR
jgi:hypothetical protein